MRNVVFISALVASLMATMLAANATTCNKRAKRCVELGGGQAACFEAARMAQCKKTKIYIAPSGRSWEAKGG